MAQTTTHNTTSIKLPAALKKRVTVLAKKEEKSVHAFLLEAIEKQTAAAERRAGFIAASLEALDEVERTGMAYPAEDVHRWLRAKVAGKKAPMPKLKPWRR